MTTIDRFNCTLLGPGRLAALERWLHYTVTTIDRFDIPSYLDQTAQNRSSRTVQSFPPLKARHISLGWYLFKTSSIVAAVVRSW